MAYTPIFSQGVKFIKIARIDDQGNDNTLSLQELNTVRVKFSDVGVVDYPITSIAKYDDYFLFGVVATNRTSSTDNEILDYKFKAGWTGSFNTFTSLTSYNLSGSVNYDNLNYFNTSSGRYILGNQPNIPITIEATASISSNISSSVTSQLYIVNTTTGTTIASSSFAITNNSTQIVSTSFSGIFTSGTQIGLSVFTDGVTSVTSSFIVTQSINPVAGISDLVVLEPFIDADFATSDYNVLAGNAIEPRINPFYMDVDYSTNALQAVNIEQILSGSATRATVQQSNYTYASHIGGRYVGQQLNGIDINTYTPATEFTGSIPGSVATGSFILSNALGADDFININYGTSEAYYFIAQDDISDNPPNYFFSESVDVPTSLFSASAKINEVLSGSNALEANILKSSFISSTLIFSASFIGDIYNSITIYTGSDFINGPPEFRFMTALNGGSDLINNDSIYGYSGFWPGDISYGKDPVINLYDSCIYEFTTAQDGYPVVENGGTISLGNIYLVGETVDNVTTIDYVSPAYQSIIERNLPVGATVYQQQYINANKLPIALQVTLNGVGVAPSSYFIPSTYVSEYTDGGPQYNVPGIIWFYGSGSVGDPTFNTPFVDFQFSPGGANPKVLGFPNTTINNDGVQQTGSLTYGNIMGPIISSSINEGNRWFISFYDNLGNIANGTGLNQFGPPVEIGNVTYITASSLISGHYNLILKTTSTELVDQLQFTAAGGIGSIGGKGTAYVTGSGYGALIWKAEVEPNLITNVGSTSDLYNDVTAGYILLDPTKPVIKNNVNFITKKYGKNAGSV